jgi:hypothetical protein
MQGALREKDESAATYEKKVCNDWAVHIHVGRSM